MEQQYADSGDYTYLAPLHAVQPWPDQVDTRIEQLEQRVRQLERTVHRLLNADAAEDPDCDRAGSY